jgi:regulator of replication initiation timing
MKSDLEQFMTNLFDTRYNQIQKELELLRASYDELIKVNKQLLVENQALRESHHSPAPTQPAALPPSPLPQPSPPKKTFDYLGPKKNCF